MKIFYCISHMNYHFNVCFFSVQTDAILTVYVWCCGFLQEFFFSSCDPVSSCWMHRDKMFATQQNDLIMWKPNSILHVKTFPLQSQLLNLILPAHKMKLRLVQNQGIQHNLTVVPFPAVNRKLRFFSCFPLANNTLTSQLLEAATCFLRLQINLFLTSAF